MAAADANNLDPNADANATPKSISEQEYCKTMLKNVQLALSVGTKMMATFGTVGIANDEQRKDIICATVLLHQMIKDFNSYSTHQHQFVIRDEYACAEKSGGREVYARTGKMEHMPVSIMLALGLSVTHYIYLMCKCAIAAYDDLTKNGHYTPPNEQSPKAMMDKDIDANLLGLGWDSMQALNLVSSSPEERARGLQTVGSIQTFVNHLRRAWYCLHPDDAPVEKIAQVVYVAMGRIAMSPDDTFRTLDSALYTQNGEKEGDPPRVSPMFYADRWLILSSMLTRRIAVRRLQRLISVRTGRDRLWPTSVDAVRREDILELAWNTIVDGIKSRVPGMPKIPTKAKLLDWAITTGDTPAMSDDVMKRIIVMVERLELMPGEAHVYRVYNPMGDVRPEAILNALRDQDEVKAIKERVGATPSQLLRDVDMDMDASPLSAACVLRILSYEHVSLMPIPVYLDEASVYWEDTIEAEFGHATARFTHPVMLQLHGVWVVSLEGMRTPPVPFSVALRMMLFAYALMEVTKHSPVSVFKLIKSISGKKSR